ncbi:arabinan endo-1,5-alpha-L-arabinosidase [Aspergillus homomorphus CBS 101889]|uniref:Arabinanase/levansucrase/invertase n=1 Tax=Aspergillus homomorphus (strain CBS 101889) TaxID=1450537 RepID=A0A395I2A2_ASPHC|nr:Arabinanase/levansucrase/invertase [Aspergillus homomorphus CBS 101889]RAL13846.1 Arabinanase/levansucrase/invertase [Aspergillus homomorphus CBS 101889]
MNTTATTRPRLLSMGSTYSEFDEEPSSKAAPLLSRPTLRRILRISAFLSLFFLVVYTLRNHFRSPSDPNNTTNNDDDIKTESEIDQHPNVSPLYPATNPTDLHIHDPSIITLPHTDSKADPDRTQTYYAYGSGPHIPIHTAPSLSGPWTHVGSVLDADSVLPIGDRKAPWAPTVVAHNGTYYCYYATSHSGCRRSAIGVATSAHPGPGGWTDHGVIVRSGVGPGSALYPFDRANAIDASVLVALGPSEEEEEEEEEKSRQPAPRRAEEGSQAGPDNDDATQDTHPTDNPRNQQAYLTFGSFWTGIWQIPLAADLLSTTYTGNAEVRHLAHEPRAIHAPNPKSNGICGDPTGSHPVEGAFISFRKPWYYLWFSWGKCCGFKPERLPREGLEYSIRVGRSLSPRGPFVDRQGRDLVQGGGEIVYRSNAEVYAPGGQGVLVDLQSGVEVDVLYYHYLNRSVGYDFHEARLGYNTLTYVDGWPVPV